jgi:hypothetical protein
MFTIEHEDEHTLIVAMDEKGEHEDLLVVLHDTDKVTIAQWSDDSDCYIGVYMTYAMLQDVSAALSLPEGVYPIEEAKEISQ